MYVVGLAIFMYSKNCIVLVKCKKAKKIKKNKDSLGVVMSFITTLAGAFTWRELLVRMLNL